MNFNNKFLMDLNNRFPSWKKVFTGAVVGGALLASGYFLNKCTDDADQNINNSTIIIKEQHETNYAPSCDSSYIVPVDSSKQSSTPQGTQPASSPEQSYTPHGTASSPNQSYAPQGTQPASSSKQSSATEPASSTSSPNEAVTETQSSIDDLILESQPCPPCTGVDMSRFNKESRLKKLGMEDSYLENGKDYRTIDTDTVVVSDYHVK